MPHTRFVDPATAPNIPIQWTVNWERERNPPWEVILQFYDRSADRKGVYKFKIDNMEFHTEGLNPDDLLWLKNIGARP